LVTDPQKYKTCGKNYEDMEAFAAQWHHQSTEGMHKEETSKRSK